MRSLFKIEQFEEVLQKMAHELPRFRKVRTEEVTLTFSYTNDGTPRRIGVQYHKRTGRIHCWRCDKTFTVKEFEEHIKQKHDGDDYYGRVEVDYWGFTIEAKNYLTSAHATKISVGSEEIKKKIEAWIEENMGSIKPEPRFQLSQVTK